ncbi:MAG: hypothetical protein E6J90_47195, partial [Deltaproteobacteria bacterium]
MTPSPIMVWTDSSQRTGRVTCWINSSRIRDGSAVGSAVTLLTTGTRGAVIGAPASAAASCSAAGFISEQWNGALTASLTARLAPAA